MIDNSLVLSLRTLITGSLSLERDSAERDFWLSKLELLNERQAVQLKEILEAEQVRRTQIQTATDEKQEKIAQEHLKELQLFSRVELPKFVKQWEALQSQAEHADDILNQL